MTLGGLMEIWSSLLGVLVGLYYDVMSIGTTRNEMIFR